jgi:hypothetical protein
VLLACAGVGVWIGLTDEVDVPGWYLGAGYAALSSLGTCAGILLRRALARR